MPNELIKYVSDQVPHGDREQTASARVRHLRQHACSCRTSASRESDVAHWRVILDSRNGEPLVSGRRRRRRHPVTQASDDVDRFTAAIDAGRILPADPNNAFDALARLKGDSRRRSNIRSARTSFRVALENKAQEVLLRYLAGDQTPQSRDEFQSGRALHGCGAHA